MKIIIFKNFIKDYREYYNEHGYFNIATEDDMNEIIDDLYNTDKFEINYENKIIELY